MNKFWLGFILGQLVWLTPLAIYGFISWINAEGQDW